MWTHEVTEGPQSVPHLAPLTGGACDPVVVGARDPIISGHLSKTVFFVLCSSFICLLKTKLFQALVTHLSFGATNIYLSSNSSHLKRRHIPVISHSCHYRVVLPHHVSCITRYSLMVVLVFCCFLCLRSKTESVMLLGESCCWARECVNKPVLPPMLSHLLSLTTRPVKLCNNY